MKKKVDIERDIKKNIFILFSLQNKSEKLVRDLNKNSDLHAFMPTMEYYRRDIDGIAKKLMYPGYVFVKSDYSQKQFDEFLTNNYSLNGEDGIIRQLKVNGTVCLTDEELNYFNLLFDRWGVLRMSYAVYFDKKRMVISRGPLKGFEDEIIKIDRHNKIAKLGVKMLGKTLVAGLWL